MNISPKTNNEELVILTKNKHRLYALERKQILNKIFDIIGITETNKKFYSHEIENDSIKKQKIFDLEPEINKYFIVCTWTAFKPKRNIERRAISIIKSLLKDMKIDVLTYQIKIKNENNKYITTTGHELKSFSEYLK